MSATHQVKAANEQDEKATQPPGVRDRVAPLQERYREAPAEAISSKWARTSSARIGIEDPWHGEVEVGRGYGVSVRYGLDDKVGGFSDLPNPGDLLCAAVAACTDSTTRLIADALGIRLEHLETEVSGDVDVRGTLNVDRDVRVGFDSLSCRVRLRPAEGTEPRMIEALVNAVERLCVNMDTLRDGATVNVETEVGA